MTDPDDTAALLQALESMADQVDPMARCSSGSSVRRSAARRCRRRWWRTTGKELEKLAGKRERFRERIAQWWVLIGKEKTQ